MSEVDRACGGAGAAWSLADVLERAAPAPVFPAYARAFDRVLEVARRLPAGLTRCLYLESWLGFHRPRLDLILKLEPGDRDVLADPALAERLGADGSTWPALGRLARTWDDPDDPIGASVRAIWLELDLAAAEPIDRIAARPRFFVDFHRAAQVDLSVDQRLELARAIALELAGGVGTDALASLRRCLAELPAGASVPYLGVFDRGSGQEPGLRACVLDLGGRLPDYLGAIGWPGDRDALAARLLEPLAASQGGGADPITVVHVDLLPGVGPRLGFEYAFPRPGRSIGLGRPDRFLDGLIARGWCTDEARHFLAGWPGRLAELLPHDVWRSDVRRSVAHIKVTWAPGGPVVAKGYHRLSFDLLAGGSLGPERIRVVSAGAERATALLDGGSAPSPAVDVAGELAQAADPRGSMSSGSPGTAVALLPLELTGGIRMTMSNTQQAALERILNRAEVDLDFRHALLDDPNKAILDGLGIRIPARFRVRFIEREQNIDALIVLPDFVRRDGELADGDLDAVAGGAGADPSELW